MLVLKPESIAGLFPPNVPRGAGCLADRSFASGPPPVAINAAAPPTYRPALCTAEIPGAKGVGDRGKAPRAPDRHPAPLPHSPHRLPVARRRPPVESPPCHGTGRHRGGGPAPPDPRGPRKGGCRLRHTV